MDKKPKIISTRNESGSYDHEYNNAAHTFYGANDHWSEGMKIREEHEEMLKRIPTMKSIETIVELEE